MSLVEVLIGVLVMMPLTLAAASGLLMTVTASDAAEREQRINAQLSTVAENVSSLPYVECATAEVYRKLYETWVPKLADAAGIEPGGADPKITGVEHWNADKGTYVDGCDRDGGAQRVTFVAIEGDDHGRGSIVKRNTAAGAGGPR